LEEAEVFIVPESGRGQRLDRWLTTLPGAATRSQITAAIAAGRVTVDGLPTKAARKLRGGESVCVAPAPRGPVAEGALPEDIALDVLWADESVIAVNKPAGMVVHPAVGNRAGTLVNALLHHFPATDWPEGQERAGIVHRLDRDTSGVILIARDVRAHEALSRQFRERTIEKRYLALVRGDVREPGEIDVPIGRHPHDRKRMSTAARRSRVASTAYRPLERFRLATLLEARPRTGRTHQIRVHLASRGWPIVSDPVYGSASARVLAADRRRWGAAAEALEAMPRQALHAWRITFVHPRSERRMEVEAPVAPDLAAVIDAVRDRTKGAAESG